MSEFEIYSPKVEYNLKKVIKVPKNATKLLVHSDMQGSIYRGVMQDYIYDADYYIRNVSYANIMQNPSAINKPTIKSYSLIEPNTNISRAKVGVFNNGNTYCFSYGENIIGTNDDFPRVEDTGTLVMKYTKHILDNNTFIKQEDGVIFAQKGTSYIDYNDNINELPGGCGLPSAVNGRQYFSSTAINNGSNNICGCGVNRLLCPCTVPINISSQGQVTVGNITELKLNVNGEIGKFDLQRLGYSYINTYYTTMPPYFNNDRNKYEWCQPTPTGFIYLESDDGITWDIISDQITNFETGICVAYARVNGVKIFATRPKWGHNKMHIGLFNDSGDIFKEYIIDGVMSSRPMLMKNGNDVLLLFTSTNGRIQSNCIRISLADGSLEFRKWFSIYSNLGWYNSFYQPSIYSNFNNAILVGNNGDVGSARGIGVVLLQANSPININQLDFVIE